LVTSSGFITTSFVKIVLMSHDCCSVLLQTLMAVREPYLLEVALQISLMLLPHSVGLFVRWKRRYVNVRCILSTLQLVNLKVEFVSLSLQQESKLKAARVHIYVRRGGPNYQTGLVKMRALGEELGVPIQVRNEDENLSRDLFKIWYKFAHLLSQATFSYQNPGPMSSY